MKGILLFICASSLVLNLNAQDIHFSQFWNNSLQYNPGMVGVTPANFRVSAGYRNQWASVASPYKTYVFNVDGRIDTKGTAAIGTGLSIYKDIAGDTDFGTTNVRLNLGTILKLDRHQKLSFGIAGGFIQKNINPSSLQWGSQYQGGQYNAAIDPGEQINMEPGFRGDISAGVVYVYHAGEKYMTANDQLNVKVGFAVNHINRPKHEWYLGNSDTLYRNLTSMGEVMIGVGNSRLTLVPSYLLHFQGPSKEIFVGSLFRYRLQEASKITGLVKSAYLSLGTHLRVGDAFVPSLMLEIHKYAIGISYDYNISKLRTASNGNGGFELTFKFRTPNPYLWQGSRASF